MSLLDRLERKLRRFAIPNLTLLIVAGQAFFYFACVANRDLLDQMTLVPDRVMEGEVWRLFVFMIMPETMHPLFIFFALYLFYIMGTALEREWGEFRYNIYILIAYLATVAAAFIFPGVSATNSYILASVFLAFAMVFPDFEILLFFILPVKVKWIAAVTWILYGVTLLTASTPTVAAMLASVANFNLFFWRDLIRLSRKASPRRAGGATVPAATKDAFHTCVVCGRSDVSHPELEFRYCPLCHGSPCYCMDHIQNHEHR